jgi:hypothetical protein
MSKGRGYELSSAWFSYAFENPHKVTSNHTALFLFLSEINNRLGWSDIFQITASECMNGMSCKSYNTYKKCLDNLIEWKFVEMVKKSVNQHQCNIIALSKYDKAQYKALDKAVTKAQYNAPLKALETFINLETIKPKNTVPEIFDFPYNSDSFKSAWDELRGSPKWKKKKESTLKNALKKLGKYPEGVAIKMMENATVGEWQGLFDLNPYEMRIAEATGTSASQPKFKDNNNF